MPNPNENSATLRSNTSRPSIARNPATGPGFRRWLRFATLALLVFSGVASAARDPRRILWLSRGARCDADGCWTTTGAYSTAVAWLRDDGWTVDEWTTGLATAPLNDVGILVVPQLGNWRVGFSMTELNLIESYVFNGGGLLIMLESQNAPWRCDQVEPLARRYGVNCISGIDYGGYARLMTFHPALEELTVHPFDLGSALRVQSPSVVVSRLSPNAPVVVTAAAESGRTGRVFMVGDSHIVGNPAITGVTGFQNRRPFLEDMVCWLSPQCGEALYIVPPADDVWCVAVGETLSVIVSATDPDGGALSLSARLLPAGASFPPVSGIGAVQSTLTFTPTANQVDQSLVATFRVVDDGSPRRSSETWTVFRVEATSPITLQPVPLQLCSGTGGSVSVAGGSAWQWEQSFDGGATWQAVSGETSELWILPPQISSSKVRCFVTAECGPIYSHTVDVTVAPPPASPADSLRAVKNGPNVDLTWSSAVGAGQYLLSRCTPASGPCSPSGAIAIAGTSATVSPAGDEWWSVSAANACGVTP